MVTYKNSPLACCDCGLRNCEAQHAAYIATHVPSSLGFFLLLTPPTLLTTTTMIIVVTTQLKLLAPTKKSLLLPAEHEPFSVIRVIFFDMMRDVKK